MHLGLRHGERLFAGLSFGPAIQGPKSGRGRGQGQETTKFKA